MVPNVLREKSNKTHEDCFQHRHMLLVKLNRNSAERLVLHVVMLLEF